MRLRQIEMVSGALSTIHHLAFSQSLGGMLESDFLNAGKDMVAVWTSPLHASGSDWLYAAGVVGAAAAVSPWDDNVDRWIVANRGASEFSVLFG